MIELKCKNCNSTDLEYIGGVWVCTSCGSKYLPDKTDTPRKSEEEKLVDKLLKLLNKQNDVDYVGYLLEHDKQLDKYIHNLKEVKDQLLALNSNNPYALTVEVRLIPLIGKWNEINADLFIRYIEEALDNITEKDKKELRDWLEDDFSAYKEKALECDPSLEKSVMELENRFIQTSI